VFVTHFPLNVLMVHSPKPTIVTDGHHQTDIAFAPGKTIRLGSLEFIADCFGRLSLSPKGNDSGVVFMGMVHNRSPSLHAILEESADEDDTNSSEGEGAPASPSLEDVT
jgi:hypothetical protein